MRMLLEVEGKKPEQVREFARIEIALKALNALGPHSFAILTRQDGSYIQVAGGGEKCFIEKRDVIENTHWRAYLAKTFDTPSDLEPFEFGSGQIEIASNEIFSIDAVISIWRAFFNSEPYPEETMWRDMTDMFHNP